MLSLLVTCVIACVVGAFAIWLITKATFDATLKDVVRGLIIFFVVVFCIITLYNGRGVFGVH